MSYFRYNAKDKAGRTVSGVVETADQKTLVDLLRRQELVIVSVREEKKREKAPLLGGLQGKVRLGELVLFSRQLATMIESGIPLVQALEILTEQTDHRGFKTVIGQVRKDVSTGTSFNEALARHPKVFSPLYINMVRAGESSGALDDIMNRLATYLEKTDSLIRKVRSAMTYPVAVSVIAITITLVMLIKIVPVFKTIYEDFGGQLPLPTQILMMISDTLRQYFVVWSVAFAAAGFVFVRFLRTERGTMWFDHFKLTMPIFGIIMRKVAVSKFCRTLSTLVKSGVPILSALEIVGKTAGNMVIEKAVDKVRVSVREGANMTEPLIKTKVFPPLVIRMIGVGEQTGELEKMLNKIAEFFEDQVDAAVQGLTTLIEPLLIAFLGIVVGTIVICMFMPIFQLATLVQNI